LHSLLNVCIIEVTLISTDVKQEGNMENQEHRQLILEILETLFELQLRSVRQILGRKEAIRDPIRRRGRKRKSLVDLSVDILTEEQRPVHIDELVDLLRQRHGRTTDRDSLSSALAKKAKQGVLVSRVAPAVFAARGQG
jgi:hypothetical protein